MVDGAKAKFSLLPGVLNIIYWLFECTTKINLAHKAWRSYFQNEKGSQKDKDERTHHLLSAQNQKRKEKDRRSRVKILNQEAHVPDY